MLCILVEQTSIKTCVCGALCVHVCVSLLNVFAQRRSKNWSLISLSLVEDFLPMLVHLSQVLCEEEEDEEEVGKMKVLAPDRDCALPSLLQWRMGIRVVEGEREGRDGRCDSKERSEEWQERRDEE